MRKKFIYRLIFLSPIVALLLSTIICLLANYIKYLERTKITERSISVINRQKLNSLEEKVERILSLNKNPLETMNQKTALSVLSSTVRVLSKKATGSGVILFEKKIQNSYYSYIITNHHVVKDIMEIKIESFDYLNNQTISAIRSYDGNIVIKNSAIDLALIQVITSSSIGTPIKFDTLKLSTKLTLYQPVFVAGCPLAKTPLITNGNVAHITNTSSTITAFSIYGNSGGGVYSVEGRLVGIVKTIAIVKSPDNIIIPEPNITFMIPGPLLRSWLIAERYQFIIYPTIQHPSDIKSLGSNKAVKTKPQY